ncbi:MAG TPA: hypothetical protein PK509_17520, partial [Catalimonadaceae bacterium]|nr:hypothetical protein [Catalimonadaceae bacterium]
MDCELPLNTGTPPNGAEYQLNVTPASCELAERLTIPDLQTESPSVCGASGLGYTLIQALVSLVST